MTNDRLNRIANTLILPDEGKKETIKTNFNTKDIIEAVLYADELVVEDLIEFSEYFEKSYSGLKSLWQFVKSNIKYKADSIDAEVIKSPRSLWSKKQGDCKSFSLFIATVLKQKGIPYSYRFAAYHGKTPTHVYIVANLEGREVILDAVYHAFDREDIYTYAIDYGMPGRKKSILNPSESYIGSIKLKSISKLALPLAVGYLIYNRLSV